MLGGTVSLSDSSSVSSCTASGQDGQAVRLSFRRHISSFPVMCRARSSVRGLVASLIASRADGCVGMRSRRVGTPPSVLLVWESCVCARCMCWFCVLLAWMRRAYCVPHWGATWRTVHGAHLAVWGRVLRARRHGFSLGLVERVVVHRVGSGWRGAPILLASHFVVSRHVPLAQ